MDRYVVFGNPVEHSLSPRIHAQFARQTGQTMDYQRALLPIDGFANGADAFFSDGGKGANVTVPFKADAYGWVSQRSALAAAAGAVNTIVWDGRLSVGHNTDGLGLIRDLSVNMGINLTAARVLLIGAGGAARGVLRPLLDSGIASLCIANRTAARAEELCTEVGPDDLQRVKAVSMASPGEGFDVVINATSAGLAGQGALVPPACVGGSVCYDMFYGGQTPFCRWAVEAQAARVVDGLGMLVEQAAEAFHLWRGVRPDTLAVLGDLRK
ncbi:MAG: shikimate dehydrogenase [Proteobacteria bacterium]|nr:shikimate dehydrogenase [Pseudomonadota bacterium]